MGRILGFLVLIVLLLALSFGWHPFASIKVVMGQRESYQVRQNGFNWLQQRKQAIEDAERQRREPPGLTDPGWVSSAPPLMNGIDGAVPYSFPTPVVRERAGAINDELFRSPVPANTPATTPSSRKK